MTEITAEERREIIAAIQTGNKTPAIKLYRQATGCRLKQAKETVESIADEMGLESKGTGYGAAILAMLLLMTLIAWWLQSA